MEWKRSAKEVSDQEVIDAYNHHKNIWRAGDELRIHGQTVQRRLIKLGIERSTRYARPEEIEKIRQFYESWDGVRDGSQAILCRSLGRTDGWVARKAKELGVNKQSWGMSEKAKRETGERTKEYIAKNGHPRGMLGKNHTEDARQKMSETRKKNPMLPEHVAARTKKMMETKNERGNLIMPRKGVTWKSGWETIGGQKIYFRSSWEVEYAHYLEFLKKAKQIKSWEYEPDIFWFEAIKRGTRSYTPDFKITNNDGSVEYHEIKGWMDAASQTKIKRMAKYHPGTKLVVLMKKELKDLGLI